MKKYITDIKKVNYIDLGKIEVKEVNYIDLEKMSKIEAKNKEVRYIDLEKIKI